MTDDKYRIAYDRRHRSYERMALSVLRPVFEKQRKDVIAYIKQNGILHLSIALNTLIQPHPMQAVFFKIYAHVGTMEGKTEIGHFNELLKTRTKDGGVSFSDAEWRNEMVNYMLLRAGSRITGITQKTREKIQYLLALAQEQGLSTDETVRFLIEQIRSPEFAGFSKARAQAIARTESTTAANYGSVLAGETLSIVYQKKWISTQDNRTRRIPRDKFDHLEMNGVKVNSKQTFFVSGEHMDHPGDPTASKGNVINCRCIVRLVPVYDESGMPIPKIPTMGRLRFAA